MNEELDQLAAEYWEYRLEVSPTTALMLGDHRHDALFEEASRAAEDANIARLREFVARAQAIDPATLTADETVSRDVLIYEAATEASLAESREDELAVNHAIGIQAMLPVIVPQFPLQEPEHAEAMVDKYRGLARFLIERSDRLREGVQRGRTPMASTVDKTIEQLEGQIALPVDQDPLLHLNPPEGWDGVDGWRDSMVEVMASHVRPAYETYLDTLVNEVLPNGRSEDEPGLSWLPDGEEYYARAIHRYTTLAMDPREVHEIGRGQIARLGDEYREIASAALGTTDLDEIFRRLREDPVLHFSSGPDIIAASERAMDKAKQEMAGWFGRLPVADCEVKETPTGPTAFYFRPAEDGSRPGTFFVNTADPTRWGTFELEAMAYHEGIPGHHLQLAIAGELEGVPAFRKHGSNSAYAEGWGLYAERLADEMGLYETALDRIGMLSNDSMRAARLVVDTGLHALGWSRQQAIDYFVENSPMSLGTIEAEVDRYIGNPGQALAYMIGRLEIMRIRAEAEARVDDRFDVREFHDVVLGAGLVPLETLDRMVIDRIR